MVWLLKESIVVDQTPILTHFSQDVLQTLVQFNLNGENEFQTRF